MTTNAKELIERFGLEPHVEGGAFRKLYLPAEKPAQRPAHGVIYYLLDENDISDFHVLDADEYWLHHAGPDVEIWWLDANNGLHIEKLGTGEGAQPCVLMPGGTVFGARIAPGQRGAMLASCVTVPEFTYDHYRILPREELLLRCPAAALFFAE